MYLVSLPDFKLVRAGSPRDCRLDAATVLQPIVSDLLHDQTIPNLKKNKGCLDQVCFVGVQL